MSTDEIWRANREKSLRDAVLAVYEDGMKNNAMRTDIIEEILVLAKDEWREAKRYIPILQYSEDNIYYGCQTDDYGNAIDPISLSEIPAERLVSFMENGKKWCFDIETLFEYVERGETLNPLTREELPPEIQAQIFEYKERSRLVKIDVKILSDKPHRIRDFTFQFTKGFPLIECLVQIFREWHALRNLPSESAPGLLSRYIVLVKPEYSEAYVPDWEEIVTYPTKFVLFDIPKEGHEKTVTYFANVTNSLRKRSELEIYTDSSNNAYRDALLEMTFLQAINYINKGKDLFLNVLTRGNINPFQKLQDINDYFIPMKTLRWMDKRSIRVKNIEDIFMTKYKRPNSSNIEQRTILNRFVLNTSIYLFEKYVKQKNYEKTLETLKFINEQSNFSYFKDYGLLFDNFSYEQVYNLLKDFALPWMIQNNSDSLPTTFKRTRYYAMLLGARTENEINILLELELNGKTNINDPSAQAVVVGLLKDPEYYTLLKDTLDHRTLYRLISEESLKAIDALMVQRQRFERVFYEGGFSTGEPPEEYQKYFDEMLEKGTNEIDDYAFSELIGYFSEPYLSVDEIYDYILRSQDKQNFLRSISMSLAEYFYILNDENKPHDEYMEIYCRVARDTRIPEETKMKIFGYVFETNFPFYQKISQRFPDHGSDTEFTTMIQELYECIGISRAVSLYENYQREKPILTRKMLSVLSDADIETLQKIFEKGIEK